MAGGTAQDGRRSSSKRAAGAGWHRHCAQCVRALTLVMDADADAAVRASCMQAAAGERHSHSHSCACQQKKLDEWPGQAARPDDLLMSPGAACDAYRFCIVACRRLLRPKWPANSSYIGQSLAAPFLAALSFSGWTTTRTRRVSKVTME